MRRESDPEARRLLAEVERLERERWPDALDAYALALLALGQQCESRAGKAEVYRWTAHRLHGLLNCPGDDWHEWRADALADIVATVAGSLWAFRASLDPRRRPNLLSMLRAAVIWRANDIAESTHRRHARREVLSDGEGVARSVDFATPATALDEVQAREVCALLAADGGAPARALLLIGQGDSISEAARRTGASRQQVYRARELLRVAVGEDE